MCRSASASRSARRNSPPAVARAARTRPASRSSARRSASAPGLPRRTWRRALDVDTGSPLIELVRVVYDRDGRGVEHLHALYRPDRYSFEFDLVRSGAARKRTPGPPAPPAAGTKRRARSKSIGQLSDSSGKGGNTMAEQRHRFSRRKFLQRRRSRLPRRRAARLAAPSLLRAQGGAVKLGFLHPVTGRAVLFRPAGPARRDRWRSTRSTPPAASSRSAAPRSSRCSATRNRRPTAAPPKSRR